MYAGSRIITKEMEALRDGHITQQEYFELCMTKLFEMIMNDQSLLNVFKRLKDR
jgi:hypothetical protein